MNYPSTCSRPNSLSALALYAITACLVLASLASRAQAEYIVGDDIFGNKEAADLVLEARKYDHIIGGKEANRDMAVELYEKAIEAQPGAPMNAELANRIAQHYAFIKDDSKGITPHSGKAAKWFEKAASLSDPTSFLWGPIHMGLGNTMFLYKEEKT